MNERVSHNPFSLVHALAAILVGLAAGGCASETAAPAAAALTGAKASTRATPSANVSKLQAWKDAELIASLAPGRTEVMGTGDSMKPVYGENTILVLSKIEFSKLQAGMTVVYLNRRGRHVAHQLLAREQDAWRVQGFNNRDEDAERVTATNLVGVVYASLTYSDAP